MLSMEIAGSKPAYLTHCCGCVLIDKESEEKSSLFFSVICMLRDL